ncbi:GIY-YIG nuclease family protein [Amphibacillus indicireducens]|uniref:GIY-YIG nuclease family protein n=1 Tax=Amphibacillus indicireducens TaxID=1076330 RepID=A0ABP7VXC2_9BACI
MSIEHCVYMIECKDGSLYTGYTNHLTNRLEMHELGKGAKYTRGRGPFKLRYHEVFETKEEAMRVEYRIKKLTRRKKLAMIQQQKIGEQIEITEKLS